MDDQRFSRQLVLPGFGAEAQQRLADARVLVVGAGGLGSAVIPALAAAGVGTIGIVDDDRVELSNLPRQLIHGEADVGSAKVASAAATVAALNPATTVEQYEFALDAPTAIALFADYDLVVDGSDNFPTRYLVNDAAQGAGIPIVWGAVSQYGGQAGASNAPHTPDYRDLFPAPPTPGSVLSCEVGGVLPTVCATIGSIMATEVVKILTGVGTPLYGRVTAMDALGGGFRELAYRRSEDSIAIDPANFDYRSFCGLPSESSSTTAAELAASLETGSPVQLVDVREPWEHEIAALPGALLIPLGQLEAGGSGGLAADVPIVVYCHHGIRSQRALELLRDAGFLSVRHLDGGIDAWALTVDSGMARY
ncbi:MAG: ThiF family adenylyltransferase [Rhodoglobus sp.]